MEQLKEDINRIFKELNHDWVGTVKEAEKTGVLNLTTMLEKFSDRQFEISQAFSTYQNRLIINDDPKTSRKKKGWF